MGFGDTSVENSNVSALDQFCGEKFWVRPDCNR